MNFGEPWWLWVLAGVGVLALVLLLTAIDPRVRSGRTVRWPRIARVTASAGGVRHTAPGRPGKRPWFLLLATVGTILALAHPRWGKIDEPVVEQAREVMIALDLSRSMLVADVPPSRLERAKLLTKNLLDSLRGERVGLIVFAGTAFVQVPLSADYQILHEFLPELNPAYMPQGGTDYDGMLRAALGGFGSDEQADRFLIVLSDGESQTDTWRERLPELRQRGVQALTLGLGTPAGGFIPDGDGAYLKDERGAVVLSRLETGTLQSLATETRGTFRNASEWVDLPALLEATVARARQGRFTTRRNERFLERFQWFLAPAVLLGLVGLWREVIVRPRQQTVRRALESTPTPKTAGTIAAALVLAFLIPPEVRAAEATPPQPAPDARVRETIARLASSPQPTARDWRELADRTLVYGSGARMQQQELAEGAIQDALAAVDLGQRASPKLTDWDKLRADLTALLDTPPEQQQQDEQQQDQQESDEQQQQDQQDQSPQQQQQDQNQSDQEQSEQQQSEQQKQDSSGESQEQKPPEPAQSQPQEGQMGEMKPQEEQAEVPPDSDTPPEPPKTRKIGARPAENQPPPTDAESALLQQRMRETAEKDSPARLFQIMEGTDKQPAPRGRDW